MRNLMNIEALKYQVGAKSDEKSLAITITRKSGAITFSKALGDKLKLAHGGRVGFTEKFDAVCKTDDSKSAKITAKKGAYFFISKGFVNHVYQLLEIQEDVLAIKIIVIDKPDENNFYELNLSKILKKVK